ncbi:MAG: sugar phosphate isomerase/epimerase family protein [Eubacteriales bacterium]|nr:sugar phosphate isomerase/epimerase family protein [Eubacteriales bacterium]
MKLGICTTDFRRAMSPEALCEKIASFGVTTAQLAFESVGIPGFAPTGELEIPESIPAAVLSALEREAARHGLDFAAVNGTFNMAHPDPAVRAEGVRRMEPLLDAARALGIPYVTICTGTRNPAHLWRPHPDNETDAAWRDMRETVGRCAEAADARGLVLCVEVEASNVVNTPEKARALLDSVGSAVKIVLDPANLFHMGTAHPGNVAETLRNALRLLSRDTVLLHGKDVREGEGLSFCGAGEGIADFAALLAGCPGAHAMLLHGAYEDAAIAKSLGFLRGLMADAG